MSRFIDVSLPRALFREDPSVGRIAEAFLAARLSATALDEYPGERPGDLAAAYEIQDAAIALCPDRVAGWKIGRIGAHWRSVFGVDRLCGPVFSSSVVAAGDEPTPFGVFVGGYAAVEAEIVLRLGRAASPDKRTWSIEEAADLIDGAFLAVELAGSPFAAINDLGPAVTISDFGNNSGLILGQPVTDWQSALVGLSCRTTIDKQIVGEKAVESLETGCLESVRFLLENLNARGIAAPAGTLVSTGAITGVHDIVAGQTATCSFGEIGSITCIAAPRRQAP